MPKMKSNRAAKKRFRLTGSGKVRRSKGGGNHGMQEKSRKRLRRLRKNDTVAASFEKRIKLMLPYGLQENTDAPRKTWFQGSSSSQPYPQARRGLLQRSQPHLR